MIQYLLIRRKTLFEKLITQLRVISLLFLILSSSLYSQSWKWLNPKPQGNILTDCAIFHNDRMIVVGLSGTIFISFDNGTNWNDYYSEINNDANLNAVSFYDDDNGIIAGGITLTTTNGGITWSKPRPVPELLDLDNISANCAYAVGYLGKVFKSENSGIDWIKQTTNVSSDLYGVSFINPDIGMIVGNDGVILKTTDGGSNWTNISFNSTDMLRCVSMITNDKVIIAGLRGAFYKSDDGGGNWERITGPLLDVLSYTDICVIDTNTFLACGGYSFTGSYCSIVKTTDGGNNWSLVYQDSRPIHLSGISSENDKIISAGFDGAIFYSDDAGLDWNRLSSGNTSVIVDLSVQDSLNIFTLARNQSVSIFYKSVNGGVNWTEYNIPTVQPLYSISFANKNIGLAVGGWANIFKTTDSGITWNRIDVSNITDTAKYFYSVDVIDTLNYFITGDSGIVLKSSDGGLTWSKNIISVYTLNNVSFSDINHGYIVGWNKVYHTSDNGITWLEGTNNDDHLLFGITAVGNNIAYASGDEGTVIRSTDGGNSWEVKPTYSDFRLNGVSFINQYDGVAIGEFGRIYHTTNGGDSWDNMTGRTLNQLYSVQMTDKNTSIITGESGTILKLKFSVPANVAEHNNDIPAFYELEQNYPNPFNPATRIGYRLMERGYVRLMVYDILGEIVEVIVNKMQDAGYYEVEFGSQAESHLASGVYLYRIEVTGKSSIPVYSDVKKMILLK